MRVLIDGEMKAYPVKESTNTKKQPKDSSKPDYKTAKPSSKLNA